MADEGRLIVERPGGRYRDAARAYVIKVDGQPVGEVRAGATASLPLPTGRHRISTHIDWTGSEAIDIDVTSGEAVRFRIESTGMSGISALFTKKPYLRMIPIAGGAPRQEHDRGGS